jgi:hypothetical protein
MKGVERDGYDVIVLWTWHGWWDEDGWHEEYEEHSREC